DRQGQVGVRSAISACGHHRHMRNGGQDQRPRYGGKSARDHFLAPSFDLANSSTANAITSVALWPKCLLRASINAFVSAVARKLICFLGAAFLARCFGVIPARRSALSLCSVALCEAYWPTKAAAKSIPSSSVSRIDLRLLLSPRPRSLDG